MKLTKKSFVVSGATLVVSVAVLAGCGSDTPQYCADATTLNASVDQLDNIDIEPGVLDNVRTDLQTVQADAQTAVDSARADFPTESSDLEDAISKASTSLQELPPEPSAVQIAAVALNVSAVVNAAQEFDSATSAECS